MDLLAGQRVLILGFGRQGQALARWLPTVDAVPIATDSKSAEVLGIDPREFRRTRFYLGETPEELLQITDMLCVSGGVPLTHPLVELARANNIPVTNDAHLFLDRTPAPIIGITGSAGKTTTTTLVGQMCKNAGWRTWVGGNIGSPLIDLMPAMRAEDQIIMELSSFQLELSYASPAIAGVLNITPNHLDRHGNMRNYIRAKANIFVHQNPSDVTVLGRDDAVCRMLEPVIRSELAWFSRQEIVANGAFLAGNRLCISGIASDTGDTQIICEVDDIPLRGEHNVSNVLAACALAGVAGVPAEVMAETIRNFQAVPHRLELVRNFKGVTFINDSIATAPERVIAALKSYEEPLILLAGGADKKLSWDEMIVLALSKTRHIIAFGRDGDIVVNMVKKYTGKTDHVTRVYTLDEAVAEAVKIAQAGDIVLLSPGGTSYDAYLDFAQRGEHFRQLVNDL